MEVLSRRAVAVAERLEAVADAERGFGGDVDDMRLLRLVAVPRLSLGDVGGAATVLRESLRLDPKQPDVAQALAEIR